MAGVASSAAQAADMVRVLRPDCCCSTSDCPGEDGIALLRRLRAAAEEVEVIAVTAATATATVRAAVQLGAVDYLVKPFDQDRLRKSLRLFERRMVDAAACAAGPTRHRPDLLRGAERAAMAAARRVEPSA